jgi:hypothetical protein
VEKKMKYYVYRPDADNYAGIGASANEHDKIVDIHYNDQPLLGSWKPVVFHGFDDNPVIEGDFPSLSDFWEIPVMSQRAWRVLRPLIEYCCEALPIENHTGRPFTIIHVMDTVDCLDLDASEVERYADGRVMHIDRYALKEDMLKDKHIFKLPRESGRELLVNEVFRGAVERNNLEGLVFKDLSMIPLS